MDECPVGSYHRVTSIVMFLFLGVGMIGPMIDTEAISELSDVHSNVGSLQPQQ